MTTMAEFPKGVPVYYGSSFNKCYEGQMVLGGIGLNRIGRLLYSRTFQSHQGAGVLCECPRQERSLEFPKLI